MSGIMQMIISNWLTRGTELRYAGKGSRPPRYRKDLDLMSFTTKSRCSSMWGARSTKYRTSRP